MTKQSDLHDQLAGQIVTSIVKPVLSSGGSTGDVLVLTESVLVGVALAVIRLGGDKRVLDHMFERAQVRLAEIRLKDIDPKGSS